MELRSCWGPPPPNLPSLEGPLVASAALDASNIVTAKINGSGQMELTAWGIESDFTVVPWAQVDAGPVADYLYIAPLGPRSAARF